MDEIEQKGKAPRPYYAAHLAAGRAPNHDTQLARKIRLRIELLDGRLASLKRHTPRLTAPAPTMGSGFAKGCSDEQN